MTEELTIVGLRRSDFDTADGKHISGISLFCEYTSDKIEGYGVEKIFITDQKLNGLTLGVGDVIVPVYNRFGKIASVRLVD